MKLAQLFEAGLLVLQAQQTSRAQMVRHVLAQNLQRAFHTSPRRDRGASRATQVRVVEVSQPVRRGLDLSPHPAFFPLQQRLVGTQPGQHRGDGVTVADDDAVHPAHLAGLGADIEAARSAHEGERGLRAGARDLHRHGASRLSQGSMSQERASPHRRGDIQAATDHGSGHPAHRTPVGIDQARLTGQGIAIADESDHVARRATQPRGSHHDELTGEPEQIGDRRAQSARRRASVQIDLDHDLAASNVEAPGEPQQGSHLSFAARRFRHGDGRELRLHLRCQRHGRELSGR